ncbi:flagellin [Methylobacterium platani]|uniref:Flagellin n=2 Tax=Methylobacterium platani TaxID=427683 RepID=A0A179SHW2_9HYPH|nr:flagellin [Methylobacterium platani]KMO16501.1 flagellin [Methylobacterium platani JCM 14648]OAS27437.1 flagellin [Methylobacterium platani]
MTSLLTNNAAMTALTTLKGINQQLDTTSNRVSTGQRVSAASDNAAYWSIATTVRTDNASLSAVKDSLGLGSSAVDTAYNGLNSIITDLQNIRGKLQSAMTPGVDRAKVQTEISAIQSKMKATADSSNSSGQNWISVDSTATNSAFQATQKVVAGFSRGSDGNITFSMVNIDVNSIKLYDKNAGSTVTKPATAAQVVGSTALTGTGAFSPGGTADFSTVDGGGKTKQVNFVIDLGAGASAAIQLDKDTLKSTAKNLAAVTTDELLAAINNQIAASGATKLGGKVTAGLDSAGRLNFTTVDTGSTVSLKVGNANTTDATKFAATDIGFGTTSNAPVLTAGTAYAALDISTGSKVITVNDGAGVKTVTLNAAAYSAAGSTVSSGAATLSGADAATLINSQLKASGSTATASFAGGKLSFTSTGAGTGASVTVAGTDVTSFGFTSGQTITGTNAGAGAGTASTTTTAKGILDTNNGTYNASFGGGAYSVATFNISTLVGTNGDTDVSNILNMVDKAIAAMTDAGTKLGANKTQIDGQKTFVDTLMKANDRTIGILVDADVEEESTKLKALQTQQQLAVQALSIANSASQNVLSLFR